MVPLHVLGLLQTQTLLNDWLEAPSTGKRAVVTHKTEFRSAARFHRVTNNCLSALLIPTERQMIECTRLMPMVFDDPTGEHLSFSAVNNQYTLIISEMSDSN